MIVERIGIIGGAGWLGSAIAESSTASGAVDPAKLVCSYRSTKPAKPVEWRWTQDNAELVAVSEIVIISVQSKDWPTLSIEAADRLVISVMAGVATADLRERAGARRIARALPNAAAKAKVSYTPVFMMSDMPGDAEKKVRELFEACGNLDIVTDRDRAVGSPRCERTRNPVPTK